MDQFMLWAKCKQNSGLILIIYQILLYCNSTRTYPLKPHHQLDAQQQKGNSHEIHQPRFDHKPQVMIVVLNVASTASLECCCSSLQYP